MIVKSLLFQYIIQPCVSISGCDTGFGRQAALRLDSMGCGVFAACLTDKGARDLDQRTSERLVTVIMDVTKDEDIEQAYKLVSSKLPKGQGRQHTLCNNMSSQYD